MSDCLFCKIVAGEIAAQKVKEDEDFLAFRDINPQAPIHFLAIPKRHVRSLNESTDAALLGNLLHFARDAAREEELADPGFRVVINTNEHGGQTVFHIHAHVLGGRALSWPPG
ncbi:MAG: histidine triad nucleotide-binding protein [Gemmatimonadota bacterium]|nr:histidine triad nucleotide-binding protein [Gemmatimonadota bacterium]MDH5805251.1 histidine triad nucleotide-binding protein [Gemmatimonadota bacterium]